MSVPKTVPHLAWMLGATLLAPAHGATLPEGDVAGFIDRHCSSCHNDVDKEAGLDLTALKYEPSDPENFLTWVRIHDRVQAGEMPPKEKRRPEPAALTAFVRGVSSSLIAHEQAQTAEFGRATRRRLNRSEYENALRDLLHAPWLQVKERLPEDGELHGFNRMSEALDVSHVHVARYMDAADFALRQVLDVHSERPPTRTVRYYAREETSLAGLRRFALQFGGQNNSSPARATFPLLGTGAQPEVRALRAPLTVGEADPATRDREAVGWVSSNYVTGYASDWRTFSVPVTGRYRLRFSGHTAWVGPGGFRVDFSQASQADPLRGVPQPPKWYHPNYDAVSPGRRDEPIHVYAGGGVARLLGTFDLKPEPRTLELEPVWLHAREYIITDSTRFVRTRTTPTHRGVRYINPLAQADGMPAAAFRWMEVEGPLYDDESTQGYRLLFGDLPLQRTIPATPEPAGRGGRARGRGRAPDPIYDVASTAPRADAERLLRNFLARSYRPPVGEDDVQLFLRLFDHHHTGLRFGFADAMLATYSAILASPTYVYLDEKPGALDGQALATRLALLLWNSKPDDALLARGTDLRRPEVLRAETERLLADPRSERFVDAFLGYWLDLRKMLETTPDAGLYNDYYLDDSLPEAAEAETKLFFNELLRRDLPARNIVDSDFTFLNERLAVHYGISNVKGVAMRRFDLAKNSLRGGFLTQAAILKVTANGTTTSPVIRGKWVMERILGFEVPPPPAAVPAVEPDIRGAATIRQQLEKHRADESCALCHRKIDPPGLALESFDVFGGWRERYRAVDPNKFPAAGFGKNSWPFVFHHGLPVETDGALADGRSFRDVRDLKRLLLQDEDQVARNFIRQLMAYATGAPVRFSDRAEIERILRVTRSREHGVGTILHEVVQSRLFLDK